MGNRPEAAVGLVPEEAELDQPLLSSLDVIVGRQELDLGGCGTGSLGVCR